MSPATASPPCIRLMLVDDHSLFRRGLRALLAHDGRFEVVGESSDVGEALRVIGPLQPDVVLLDNHLPGVRGVDAIPALKDAAPGARVLMLTVSEDADDLAQALQNGADGYLLKTMESDQLTDAILKVLDGESTISPDMLGKLIAAFRRRTDAPVPPALPTPAAPPTHLAASPVLDPLSPREREILTLIARGDSNKHIARALDIAETTVKIHVQHILKKLNLSSRVQAAVLATQHGLG